MSKKKIPPFDPGKPPFRDTTLARQVARQNLTRLNNAFWVSEHSYPPVKSAFGSLTFPTDPKAHGCFGSEGQWSAAVDEARVWTRQHIMVSAASLLEVYLASALAASLWARPDYADRSLTGIREVELIKYPERAPGLKKAIETHVNSMLKGEWANRFRRIASVFGKLPPKLEGLTARLQSLQDQRNRVAHNFGQKGKDLRRTPWSSIDLLILDVPEVEESLVCVSHAIREADLHVFAPLIGGYEFLFEYHSWLRKQTDPFARSAPDLREAHFRKHVAGKFGSGPNKKYYQALIRYYDACS